MAMDPNFLSLEFISICIDNLDGAREIIEENDELKWQNISHYYMDFESKEEAKRSLEFNSVPFYVMLDEHGNIIQKGGEKQVSFKKNSLFPPLSASQGDLHQENVSSICFIQDLNTPEETRILEMDEDF
mmetsp:Transcript_15969/g.17743  ORF Transcript_15969/g.17743 Transcript_15969/m.17743 type:complete len:129 (+) Transcript_15969:231-617(+)